MVRIFREGPGPNALAVAMIGVRLGERELLVGDAGPLFAELAAKVGLTGRALAVTGSEESADRLRVDAARAGVLLDGEAGRLTDLQVEDGVFDLALIDAGPTLLTRLDRQGRIALARSVYRAVRTGARVIVSERRVLNLFGLVRTNPQGLEAFHGEGGAAALLDAGGFRPIRLIAEREGQRFTEGRKPGSSATDSRRPQT